MNLRPIITPIYISIVMTGGALFFVLLLLIKGLAVLSTIPLLQIGADLLLEGFEKTMNLLPRPKGV